MVPKLGGKSYIDAHVWSEIVNLICLRHFFLDREQSQT